MPETQTGKIKILVADDERGARMALEVAPFEGGLVLLQEYDSRGVMAELKGGL